MQIFVLPSHSWVWFYCTLIMKLQYQVCWVLVSKTLQNNKKQTPATHLFTFPTFTFMFEFKTHLPRIFFVTCPHKGSAWWIIWLWRKQIQRKRKSKFHSGFSFSPLPALRLLTSDRDILDLFYILYLPVCLGMCWFPEVERENIQNRAIKWFYVLILTQ